MKSPKVITDDDKPRIINDVEAAKIFPCGRHLIHRNVQKNRARKNILWADIRASLNRGRKEEYAEREVMKEMTKLVLGRALDKTEENLSRLRLAESLLNGNKPLQDRITKDMAERARNIPLESVCGLELKRAGRYFKSLCCFHSEKTASLVIYPGSGGFYCFSCGAGGDAIKFYQMRFGLSFPQAVRNLLGVMA